jgi:hypothetical protein
LIENAPDHRKIADARRRTNAWALTNALHASIRAIERGVEYFAGQPALPGPLKVLTDGIEWPGSIAEVEAAIAKLDGIIRRHRDQLDQQLTDAATLLAELGAL